MVVKNVGSALRFCIPQQVGKKIGEFWELIKPLIDFKYEVSESFNFRYKKYLHSIVIDISNSILIFISKCDGCIISIGYHIKMGACLQVSSLT